MAIAISGNQASPAIKQSARTAVLARAPLAIILALQALVSLITLRNTAFQDEALYVFAGRQIINSWTGGPPTTEPYVTYFSGYPDLYPAFAGWLDKLGGLEAVRFFSLLCMLGVTLCVYAITKRLFGGTSALFATAIFAFQGSVLYIGRLATYDAVCLLLLALATTLALAVLPKSLGLTLLKSFAIGPLLLLAVGAKYAGLLFVPSILLLLFFQTMHVRRQRDAWLGVGAALLSLGLGLGAVLRFLNRDALIGLSFTTTNRVAFLKTPALTLAIEVVTLGGIALALGFLGFLLLRQERFWLTLTLVGTSLLAPAYHIYKGEQISLDKHVAFAIFFIVPLAGVAITRVAGSIQQGMRSQIWPLGLAVCLVVFSFGLQQSHNEYTVWANSSQMIAVMRTQVRPVTGHYLAEEYDVSRYYLQDVTLPWQWTGLNWFQYTDKANQQLTGIPAYRAAIAEGYFDVVELNYGFNVSLDLAIDGGLKGGQMYHLVEKIPYVNFYGPGFYWIWAKNMPTSPTPATP